MEKKGMQSKNERMYLLLKGMCKFNIRTFQDLAKEIGVTEPTLRSFFNGDYSEKTLKLVENRFLSTVTYLSEQSCYYRDVKYDRE